jgi:hypothetical protein
MRKAYKYSLKGNKKYICPKCGRKTFVPYFDNETSEILNLTVGKCDRENNCQYHFTPKEFFHRKGVPMPEYTFVKNKDEDIVKPVSFIDESYFNPTVSAFKDNNLFQWMINLFDDDKWKEDCYNAISKYKIGSANGRSTVFWQIDIDNKIRSGKVITYKKNGKRNKDIFPPVKWVHVLLKLNDFNLKQCFFGEHLLLNEEDKTVAIVESEKTALLMSVFRPNMIWLASGGSEGLSSDKCKVIKGKSVILYPDLKQFDKWKIKADLYGFTISTELESVATQEMRDNGDDILDYLLMQHGKI